MLSKKIDRAMRICGVVRDFRSEVEAEMCDDADRLSGRMCKACEVKLKALKQKD